MPAGGGCQGESGFGSGQRSLGGEMFAYLKYWLQITRERAREGENFGFGSGFFRPRPFCILYFSMPGIREIANRRSNGW